MNKKIKVSIVIPVYNVSLYLRQCLDSVCNQTLKENEIICVDDGSTDNSLEILYEYEKKYTNFKVLINTQEGPGAAHARNKGIDYATGEYLLVLDSDDYFDLQLAEKTYNKAVETDADVIIYDAQFFDSETGVFVKTAMMIDVDLIPKKDFFSANDIPSDILQITNSSAWNKLYKTSFIKDNLIAFQAVGIIDDTFFICSALILANRIAILQEKLLFYRKDNSSSQVNNLDREPMAVIKLAISFKEFLVKKNIFDKFQKTCIIKIIDTCIWSFYRLKTHDNFKQLYDYVYSGELDDLLEISRFLETNDLPLYAKEWILEIKNHSLSEYLYNKYQTNPLAKTHVFIHHFPNHLVNKKDNVILYGAGDVGHIFYSQNLLLEYCNIVAWVDKNYENLHKPVEGLDVLKSGEYDKIIIAVEDEFVVEKIKEDLLDLGVDGDKIKWK